MVEATWQDKLNTSFSSSQKTFTENIEKFLNASSETIVAHLIYFLGNLTRKWQATAASAPPARPRISRRNNLSSSHGRMARI